jgi:hypothetical protein
LTRYRIDAQLDGVGANEPRGLTGRVDERACGCKASSPPTESSPALVTNCMTALPGPSIANLTAIVSTIRRIPSGMSNVTGKFWLPKNKVSFTSPVTVPVTGTGLPGYSPLQRASTRPPWDQAPGQR